MTQLIHNTIQRMAQTMQHKLEVNKHKDKPTDQWPRDEHGRRDGWSGVSLEYLMEKLGEEMRELMDAIAANDSPESVWCEAADVANIAMMLAENYEVTKQIR